MSSSLLFIATTIIFIVGVVEGRGRMFFPSDSLHQHLHPGHDSHVDLYHLTHDDKTSAEISRHFVVHVKQSGVTQKELYWALFGENNMNKNSDDDIHVHDTRLHHVPTHSYLVYTTPNHLHRVIHNNNNNLIDSVYLWGADNKTTTQFSSFGPRFDVSVSFHTLAELEDHIQVLQKILMRANVTSFKMSVFNKTGKVRIKIIEDNNNNNNN
eukprot:PhM_4_TR589/c0_g1_i1/m.86311